MANYKTDALFCKVYPYVLRVEGGYSNDPKDPGGPTMFGIAWNYNAGALAPLGLTRMTMRSLTKDQALQIFYEKYWLASAAENIKDEGLAYLHLDTAVNCGVGEAVTILKHLSFDSQVSYSRLQFLQLVHEYESLRLEYYNSLRPDLKARYLKGWLNRMNFVIKQSAKLDI